jgi:hypothetical protein
MKRDMNLVREILLWIESQEHGGVAANPTIEGSTEEEIAYHVYIMWKASLVEAIDVGEMGNLSPQALLSNISWNGHEFIQAAADDTIWAKAKKTLFNTSTSITFDLLLEWLKAEGRQKLGLP